jgi:NAD(P)-dependent dehydrogenase (short-subunit alcohol dehydrogenase family)
MDAGVFDLTGKVAIVTGAGRGLGRAMAAGLSRYGADVMVVSRTKEQVEELARTLSPNRRKAAAMRIDCSKKTDVDRMVAAAMKRWGRIDILVNNAGIDFNQPALDYDEALWDQIIDTNLKGYFLCAQAVGRTMVERRAGSIIMNSSIYGSVGAPDNLPYGASKGGVNQLTRMLAVEWAPHNVRVNAVAPGYMSPMSRKPGEPGPSPELERRVKNRTPMGRRGAPDELVGPVVFLASNASSYVTGAILAIDGGWTAA